MADGAGADVAVLCAVRAVALDSQRAVDVRFRLLGPSIAATSGMWLLIQRIFQGLARSLRALFGRGTTVHRDDRARSDAPQETQPLTRVQ